MRNYFKRFEDDTAHQKQNPKPNPGPLFQESKPVSPIPEPEPVFVARVCVYCGKPDVDRSCDCWEIPF